MLASTRRYCPSQASCRASHAASVVGIRTPIICHAAPAATRELPPFSLGTQRFKKIIFLRHAESEQRSNCKDHDRPLSDGGRLQAIECAQELQARGWIPDLVLASNAKRTRETLDEMSGVISQLGDVDAHYYGSLYTVAALDGQTATHLQECLLEVVDDARHQCVLLVGHNKGWEEAASSFSGCAIKLKTASAALLQAAAASWAEVLSDDGQWQLVDVVTPASAT